jgi:hypothetical protein
MVNEYICVTGQDGEIYEVCPTEALLSFLKRLAEGEAAEHQSVSRISFFAPEETKRSCASNPA